MEINVSLFQVDKGNKKKVLQGAIPKRRRHGVVMDDNPAIRDISCKSKSHNNSPSMLNRNDSSNSHSSPSVRKKNDSSNNHLKPPSADLNEVSFWLGLL